MWTVCGTVCALGGGPLHLPIPLLFRLGFAGERWLASGHGRARASGPARPRPRRPFPPRAGVGSPFVGEFFNPLLGVGGPGRP